MNQRITLNCNFLHATLLTALTAFLTLFIGTLAAQNSFCANETPLWIENFGTGTTATDHPDILTSALTYQAAGSLTAEGVYRVINNTQQKPEWHRTNDHTGNQYGKMLVVNGNGNDFYSHILNSPSGFPPGFYASSLFIMNVNKPGTCGPNALLPLITFTLEYQAADNSWQLLGGSPVSTPPVPQSATPTWVKLGGVFTLPVTGGFIVKNIRITLQDGITGGCGNDYALDDIVFSTCPEGGPLPVQFLNVTAKQKNNQVAINWSTGTEISNKYYDVEKSIDGGSNWMLVATQKTDGNSSIVKKYDAYDIRPVPGINYYRIKQVDQDGKYKYSVTVTVKILIEKTSALVLGNPFIHDIPIEFLSKGNESVSLTLYDLTGKRVANDKWNIPKGSSRKAFDKAGNIKKGMYILNITGENGEVIYKGKLIKQ
ncbi:MAG: T9SS type A sorting domain-containing protein [Ferruginibacter sp.]